MRAWLAALAVLLAACGGDTGSPVDPPPPPPSGTVTLPDQTLAVSGGTLTVSAPGASIDGMTIRVRSGSFTASQTIGISYNPLTTFAAPAGATVISPVLTIRTSDGSVAKRPMLVTIPAAVPSGSVPAIILRDPTTGRQEVLPTVAWSATSVTGMTSHFNGGKLMGNNGAIGAFQAPSLASSAFSAYEIGFAEAPAVGIAAVVAIPEAQLALDRDTGFRPGVDSWEFSARESILTDGVLLGLVLTEAWYYVAKKATNGPLWKKYQEAEGISGSNRRGWRWASVVAGSAFDGIRDGLTEITAEVVAQGGPDPAGRLSLASFHAIRAGFAANPGTPQIAYLLPADFELPSTAVLVYRSSGQQLFAVNPGFPDQSMTIDFTSGRMAPLTPAGSSVTFTSMVGSGFALLGKAEVIEDQWNAVANGTVGTNEFPEYRMMVGWGNANGETARLTGNVVYAYGDESWPVVYAECVSCKGEPRGATLPPGSAQLAALGVHSTNVSGSWTFSGMEQGLPITLDEPGDRRWGLEISSREDGDNRYYWTDWFSLTVRRLAAEITPAAPVIGPNADLTLTMNVTNPPTNLEYEWDFDDGTARQITTTPEVTHKWTAGSYLTQVTARDRTTRQPVARAKERIEVRSVPPEPAEEPYWRIVAFTRNLVQPGPPTRPEEQQFFNGVMQWLNRLVANPTSGMITVVENPVDVTQSTLTLKVSMSASWPETGCCPPVDPGSTSISLGTNPATPQAFGPAFASSTHAWSQTSQNLGEGTMTGSAVLGEPADFRFTMLNVQSGPLGTLTFGGTRTGKDLQGTLTFRGNTRFGDGYISGSYTYQYTFQAVRYK